MKKLLILTFVLLNFFGCQSTENKTEVPKELMTPSQIFEIKSLKRKVFELEGRTYSETEINDFIDVISNQDTAYAESVMIGYKALISRLTEIKKELDLEKTKYKPPYFNTLPLYFDSLTGAIIEHCISGIDRIPVELVMNQLSADERRHYFVLKEISDEKAYDFIAPVRERLLEEAKSQNIYKDQLLEVSGTFERRYVTYDKNTKTLNFNFSQITGHKDVVTTVKSKHNNMHNSYFSSSKNSGTGYWLRNTYKLTSESSYGNQFAKSSNLYRTYSLVLPEEKVYSTVKNIMDWKNKTNYKAKLAISGCTGSNILMANLVQLELSNTADMVPIYSWVKSELKISE
jgi:hypothetical protein